MEVTVKSESETVKLAQELADGLADSSLILLHGDLGAGKTVFARALIRALSHSPNLEVPSPTFTLLETYNIPGDREVWHFDLYRLEDEDEVFELGWEEAIEKNVIMIVEWPQRLGYLEPKSYIQVNIHNLESNAAGRRICISRVSEA